MSLAARSSTAPLQVTRAALAGLTVGAVALVLVDFGTFRSLWLDEAMLSLNIARRSFEGLLAPLDWLQVAPIGFLWVEKAFFEVFGGSDWSLRVFPVLAYVASVPLFYQLSRHFFDSTTLRWLATAIYANAYASSHYATEVKQYMGDGLVSIALTLGILGFAERRSPQTAAGLAALGAASLWMSNIAVIVLFALGLYLLYEVRSADRRARWLTVAPMAVWVASFGVYFVRFIHDNPNQPGMMAYWEHMNVFLPYNVASVEFWEQLWYKVEVVAKLVCQYRRFSLPLFGLVVLGGAAFAKTDRRLAYLLLAPAAVHLAIAYFKLYPFEVRMSLYLLPFATILLARGVREAYRTASQRWPSLPVGVVGLVPLLLFGLNVGGTATAEVEATKPALAYLEANARAGDTVYVYYKARPAVEFYLRGYPALTERVTLVYGSDGDKEWQLFSEDIRRLPAVDWLVFAGPPGMLSAAGYGLEDYFLCLVRDTGHAVASERHFTGASVYGLKAVVRMHP